MISLFLICQKGLEFYLNNICLNVSSSFTENIINICFTASEAKSDVNNSFSFFAIYFPFTTAKIPLTFDSPPYPVSCLCAYKVFKLSVVYNIFFSNMHLKIFWHILWISFISFMHVYVSFFGGGVFSLEQNSIC